MNTGKASKKFQKEYHCITDSCGEATMHSVLADLRSVQHRVISGCPVEEMTQKIQAVCGAFSILPMSLREGIVDGAVSTLQAAAYDIALVSLNAKQVVRDQLMIKRNPGEHLFLLTQTKGYCQVQQSDQACLLRPGDMYLVDSAKASNFIYDGTMSRQLSVHLPRSEMVHRFGDSCTGGISIDKTDPLTIAMQAVLAKVVCADSLHQSRLIETFFSLFGNYLRCRKVSLHCQHSATEKLVTQSLQLIEQHAADPAFGCAELANMLCVSPRTLQRAFTPMEETISQRISSVRLKRARTRLECSARSLDANIALIAFESGFNDLSYFYRAFRKQFGITPGSVRNTLS